MNTCLLEPSETKDHDEWLAGIVITDVRSMKEDKESASEILFDNYASSNDHGLEKYKDLNMSADTDSEGEEVDVEYIEEDSNEPQCEALRKLTNLSTVELENQALCLNEDDYLQDFLKTTLEGSESEESSDSEAESGNCDSLRKKKHVDRSAFKIENCDSLTDAKLCHNTENESKPLLRFPYNYLTKGKNSSLQTHLQKSAKMTSRLMTGISIPSSYDNVIPNKNNVDIFNRDFHNKSSSKVHIESHISHSTSFSAKDDKVSKQIEVHNCEQEEKDPKLRNHYLSDIFNDAEFSDIIPNFDGFPLKNCHTPKHKFWRVKHLSASKYIKDDNANNILCNRTETTCPKFNMQDLSKKHAQMFDDDMPIINKKAMVKIKSIEKFHAGIMTRKKTAQFKEIFIGEDVQINNVNLKAKHFRNKEDKNENKDHLLKNTSQTFSKNMCEVNRHFGVSEQATRVIKTNSTSFNIDTEQMMAEKQLSLENKKTHKTEFPSCLSKTKGDVNLVNGNINDNSGNNPKSDTVMLHGQEDASWFLEPCCDKEMRLDKVDLHMSPYPKISQEELVINVEAPQSFVNCNVSKNVCPRLCNDKEKLGVKNGLICSKGYKRKLSFSCGNNLKLEKETPWGDINLELGNKRNCRYPMVTLKRCDYVENKKKLFYDEKPIDENISFASKISTCGVTLKPYPLSTLKNFNSRLKSNNSPVESNSDYEFNVDNISLQPVSDAVKNISIVANESASKVNDESNLDVNKILLSNSAEIDKVDRKIHGSSNSETNMFPILIIPETNEGRYQNKDDNKDCNINKKVFSHDLFELSNGKTFKAPKFSNDITPSFNLENKFEKKSSNPPQVKNISNQLRANKENLVESDLNLQFTAFLKNVPKKSIFNHISVHIKENDLVCNKCNSIFTNFHSLKEHYPICSQLKQCIYRPEEAVSAQLQCSICDHRFTRKGDYDNHLNFHLGLLNYLCEICGFAFSSELQLQSHEKIHFDHAVKTYYCNVCFIQCNSLQNKIQHENIHAKQFDSFLCVNCNIHFPDAISLHFHQQNFHDILTHKCTQCNLTFKRVPEMEDHYYYSHFSCYKCDCTFSCFEDIRDHFSSHQSVIKISHKVVDRDIAKQYVNIKCTA